MSIIKKASLLLVQYYPQLCLEMKRYWLLGIFMFISNIEVPLPSLVEQKKILGKIDSISNEHEDFLNESDVQIDLFGKLRQAVLQEAVEGKLTAKWREQYPDLISGNNHASKLLEKIKAEKERLIKEDKINK